ncbi:unnamed protein product, partial [Prorocentrum cordatum]
MRSDIRDAAAMLPDHGDLLFGATMRPWSFCGMREGADPLTAPRLPSLSLTGVGECALARPAAAWTPAEALGDPGRAAGRLGGDRAALGSQRPTGSLGPGQARAAEPAAPAAARTGGGELQARGGGPRGGQRRGLRGGAGGAHPRAARGLAAAPAGRGRQREEPEVRPAEPVRARGHGRPGGLPRQPD